MIDTLQNCQSYWVTVTAVNCASRIRSQAFAIGLQEPRTFGVSFSLPAGRQCTTWINDNLGIKINQVDTAILDVLNGDVCQMPSVRCAIDTRLFCTSDSTEVTYQ